MGSTLHLDADSEHRFRPRVFVSISEGLILPRTWSSLRICFSIRSRTKWKRRSMCRETGLFCRFFDCRTAGRLSQKVLIVTIDEGRSSRNRFRAHRASWQPELKAISSDSIVDNDTQGCRLLLQQTGESPRKVIVPDVDFMSFGNGRDSDDSSDNFLPPQSASV